MAEQQREAFEQWMAGRGYQQERFERHAGEYLDGKVFDAWMIWKAALSHAEGEAQPVAVLIREIGEDTWFDHAPVPPNSPEHTAAQRSPELDYCVVYAGPAPQVATGWRTSKDGAEWPKQGRKYLIKLNGVLQHEVYEFDQADDGGFGGGQHFWSREELDECPSFDPERDEWLPVEEAGAMAAPQVAVPEGYALVPVKPTEEMLDAWFTAPRGDGGSVQDFASAYRAMLAAAPTAPAGKEGE